MFLSIDKKSPREFYIINKMNNNQQTVKELREMEGEMTCVYFGAFTDMWPLRLNFFKGFKKFIYIDMLPNKTMWSKTQAGYIESKDRSTFINSMKENLNPDFFKYKFIDNGGDILEFRFDDGRVLKYYMNIKAEIAIENDELRDVLKNAD